MVTGVAVNRPMPVREAAELLGVSYSTLKQWILKGAVRTVRTEGGHHRVPPSEVDRLLAAEGAPPVRSGSVARTGVVALSGRNQLRGVIQEVRVEGLLAHVRMRIGEQPLTAVITREAAAELKLKRGDEAIAIIKSTEVMVGRDAPRQPGHTNAQGHRSGGASTRGTRAQDVSSASTDSRISHRRRKR